MAKIGFHTGPLPSLKRAIKEAKTNGWFQAIVLAAVNLEHYGFLELKFHVNSLDLHYKAEDLDALHLRHIALMLYVTGKIEQQDYDIILRINSLRNKVMHRRMKRRTLIGKEADEQIQPLIEDTIRILQEKLNAVKLFV